MKMQSSSATSSVAKILVIFLLLPAASFAQNAAETLAKINKHYQQADSYDMEFQVKIFASNNGEVLQDQHGTVTRNGSSQVLGYLGLTTLQNDRCQIVVNHNTKQVIYKNTNKHHNDNAANSYKVEEMLQQWKEAGYQPKWKGEAQGALRKMEVVVFDPLVNRIELTVDTESMTLKQVVYFYQVLEGNSAERVEINYSKVVLNPKLPRNTFSEKAIVKAQGNKLILAEAYHQYELIDQR